MNTFYEYDNEAQEHPLKEKLFTSWKPQHILVIYPKEFEDEHDLSFIEIIHGARRYLATGEFNRIPIIENDISASDALEYADREDYVKYWVPPTDVIRLTDEDFWEINPTPSGEIALITEADIELYYAIIFTEHWFYSIDYNYNYDDDTDNNDDDQDLNDNENEEIDSDDVMDYHCEDTEMFDYGTDTDSQDLSFDDNLSYSMDEIE